MRGVDAGWLWVTGAIGGSGVSGFAWMNPYIALSLLVGGLVLGAVVLVAVRA